MLTIKGAIEGVAPLLFSRMYTDMEGPGGKPSSEEKAAEAFNKLHRDDNGAYIPAAMFKQSILGGAKAGSVKNGRASFATLFEAVLFAQGHLYLGKETYDQVFEHWGRRPPRTGGSIIIRYPWFDVGWKAAFTLVLTQGDKHTAEAVRQSLDAAGLLVGLGSWRPEYGRFLVTEFAVEGLT